MVGQNENNNVAIVDAMVASTQVCSFPSYEWQGICGGNVAVAWMTFRSISFLSKSPMLLDVRDAEHFILGQ